MRRKRKEVEKVENEIAELDNELSKIEVALTQATEPEKLTELSNKYSEIKAERDRKMDLWMELSEFIKHQIQEKIRFNINNFEYLNKYI